MAFGVKAIAECRHNRRALRQQPECSYQFGKLLMRCRRRSQPGQRLMHCHFQQIHPRSSRPVCCCVLAEQLGNTVCPSSSQQSLQVQLQVSLNITSHMSTIDSTVGSAWGQKVTKIGLKAAGKCCCGSARVKGGCCCAKWLLCDVGGTTTEKRKVLAHAL